MGSKLIKSLCFALIMLLLASCDPEIRCNVLHIGDSLIATSAVEIESMELRQDKAVMPVMNAIQGAGLIHNYYWIPRIGYIKQQVKLDIVFISLGVNDLLLFSEDFPTSQELDQKIDDLLSAIGNESVVYWISPHKSIRNICPNPQDFDDMKNAIRRACFSGKWPNLNWLSYDIWIAHQGKDMNLMLTTDKSHFTKAGKEEFAAFIQFFIDSSSQI